MTVTAVEARGWVGRRVHVTLDDQQTLVGYAIHVGFHHTAGVWDLVLNDVEVNVAGAAGPVPVGVRIVHIGQIAQITST